MEVLGCLNTACRLLAIPSARPRRSPALPLEVISHIISLAQHPTDFEERQQTNFTLSRTSRDIYRLVRPILRREVHITQAHQFSRVAALLKAQPDRFSEVRTISAVVHPEQLQLQDDGTWYGRFFPEAIGMLAASAQSHTGSSLHLRTVSRPQSNKPWYGMVTGDEGLSFNHLIKVGSELDQLSVEHGFDSEVDGNDFDMYYAIVALGSRIKRFHFTGLSPCAEWRAVYEREGLLVELYDSYGLSAPDLE